MHIPLQVAGVWQRYIHCVVWYGVIAWYNAIEVILKYLDLFLLFLKCDENIFSELSVVQGYHSFM